MRTRFFRCQLPLMMSTGLLPIPLLMGCFWGNGELLPWLIAPAAYLLLACLCMLVPGKWRLLVAIPGVIVLSVASFGAVQSEAVIIRLLSPIIYTGLLLFTLPMAGWARGVEPPMAIPAMGVCAHLIAQFMLFVKPSPIAAVPHMLIASFIVFLLLFMLSLNRQSMAEAMPDSHSVPVSIRKRNRLLTWILLGVVLMISLIPALAQFVEQAFEWIKQIILAFVKWLMSLFQSQSVDREPSGMQDMSGGMGGGETSALAKMLEKVFMALAAIAIALIALWVLRFLFRKLKQLAMYLYGQLRHYASTAAEDYVDEVEDTREQGEEHFGIAQRLLRRRHAQRNLKDLPPREQIRTRYGLMRGKHPEWEKSYTARETLNKTAAQLYEKARYSSHEITAQDSEAFASQPKP